MVAPTADLAGLGLDGYLRMQNEAVYGTAITAGMTDVKQLPETLITLNNMNIDNANVIASRVKQDPDTGRKRVEGAIEMDQDPTIMGEIYEWLLGAATSTGAATTGYTHTWLSPITGLQAGTSKTIQQAIGGNTVDQFDGVVATGLTLTSDNEGNQKASIPVVGQGHLSDVARVSSWSFGAVPAYYFGMTCVNITVDGFDVYTQKVDGYEFTIDMGYATEEYKLCASGEIDRPSFNSLVLGSLKMTIDADRNFMDWARAHTEMKVVLTTTHTTLAGSASGYYTTEIEIPVARVKPETTIPNTNEKTKMDLELDLYGGATTGSSSSVRAFEIRQLDATATYTG